MNAAFEAMLAARVHASGRAIRRTTLRHTHLDDKPLGICLWRLGGERFRAAALAWGPIDEAPRIAVAGEPRNRELYFQALLPFAKDLCERLEVTTAAREHSDRAWDDNVPARALQIVVPNRATVTALSYLGRYLAYLTDRDGLAPDPALVLAGKHLRFYARHAVVPGQSLLIPLDRLVADHWATLQSPFERANLAALDAQISPPRRQHAFVASNLAEVALPVGPEPTEEIDRRTAALLEVFNDERAGSTDPPLIRKLIGPLRDHYSGLIEPVWALMQRTFERERALAAAPSVARRDKEDRRALRDHIDWVANGGRYRTRDTARVAAMRLRRLEQAQRRYEAERALDDPACMVPYLLDGEAVRGTVSRVDINHREPGPKQMVVRPEIVVECDDVVVLPHGKHLWWTATADDKPWRVESAARHEHGTTITLVLEASPNERRVPAEGDEITLSTLNTAPEVPPYPMPKVSPWTHTPRGEPTVEPIDAGDAESITPAEEVGVLETDVQP